MLIISQDGKTALNADHCLEFKVSRIAHERWIMTRNGNPIYENLTLSSKQEAVKELEAKFGIVYPQNKGVFDVEKRSNDEWAILADGFILGRYSTNHDAHEAFELLVFSVGNKNNGIFAMPQTVNKEGE